MRKFEDIIRECLFESSNKFYESFDINRIKVRKKRGEFQVDIAKTISKDYSPRSAFDIAQEIVQESIFDKEIVEQVTITPEGMIIATPTLKFKTEFIKYVEKE